MSLQIKKLKDRFASREYRVWICRQQCLFCKSRECDPHHLKSRKYADGSDATCVPLCREHHNDIHAHKIDMKEIQHKVFLLQLEFLYENLIDHNYPFTQEQFESYLRDAGLTEQAFSRRKNRQ